jgi:hypothetical protein
MREIGGNHQRRRRRQQPNQLREHRFHVFHVPIDVGMIELHRRQQHCLRAVVQELGAFVEERRVVLITLNDEELSAAEPVVPAEV